MECETQNQLEQSENTSQQKNQIPSSDSLSYNKLTSLNEINDINENKIYQTKLMKLQNKKECRRKKKNEKQLIAMTYDIQYNIKYKDKFTIFGGIDVQIGKDIYLESQYQKTSIGESIKKPLQLKLNNEKNRIDLILLPTPKGRDDFLFLKDLCLTKQSQEYKQLADLIEEYHKKITSFQAKGNKINRITKEHLNEIDNEYNKFVEYCFNIINSKDNNDIYRYSIGDIEIQYSGMSNGFFHLIGMNYQMYEQLSLRGKQLSLKSKETNKLQLSMYAIQNRLDFFCQESYFGYKIKTIDGFTLKVTEKVTKILSPFTEHSFTPIDHLGHIVECEIDQESISQLIQFRENIVLENNLSSYDEYMKQVYEENLQDIEYTILSEQFLSKFYPTKYQQMSNEKYNLYKSKSIYKK